MSAGKIWRQFVLLSSSCLAGECLVLTEVGDGHTKRIYWNQPVGNLVFEQKNKVGRVQGFLQHRMVRGCVFNLDEIDGSPEGWVLHAFQADLDRKSTRLNSS